MTVPVAALLAGALLVGSGPASGEPHSAGVVPGKTVRSADGLLMLIIPRGAMERNVPIRISVLRRGAWPRELRGKVRPAGKVYELEPELRFRRPVTVVRRFPAFDVSAGLPALWFASAPPQARARTAHESM